MHREVFKIKIKIITKRSTIKRKYNRDNKRMTTQDTSTRRRVKLYALNADRQWDDRGTGHVTSSYVERLKGKTSIIEYIMFQFVIFIYWSTIRHLITGTCRE